MLISLILEFATIIITTFQSIMPSSSFWPLPSGITSGLSWLGTQIGVAGTFLPTGALPQLFAAITFAATVNIFVLPWLAARYFRLPFAAMNKA